MKRRNVLVTSSVLTVSALPSIAFVRNSFHRTRIFSTVVTRINSERISMMLSSVTPGATNGDTVSRPHVVCLYRLTISFTLTALPRNNTLVVGIFRNRNARRLHGRVRLSFDGVHDVGPNTSQPHSGRVF